MRNGFIWGLGLSMLAVGCASMEGEYYSGSEGGRADTTGSGSTSTPPGGGLTAGTLTAGTWDDNRNFERFVDYLSTGASPLPFSAAEHEAAHARYGGELDAHRRLEIALVIDTTGSMADEIAYLQTELDAIAARVNAAYPSAETRWALVVYRDEGDEYVTRVFDFRDVDSLRSDLRAQGANGGGDYPEASHAALSDMTNLSWREGADVARLAFWVADAPHHDDKAGELTEAVRTAGQLDVHIYPVASSGVDDVTEVSMRSAAQITGGRYLFLTDDSGVGGTHLEPTIPCYFVTLLSDAMLRMVDIEMTGDYREPSPEQIIRTGGDPTDGACTLEGGEVVYIF